MEYRITEDKSYFDLSINEKLEIEFFNRDVIPYRNFLIVLDGEKIIALATYSIRNNSYFMIGYISTHKDYRNKGIGKTLANKLLDMAKEMELPVYTGCFEELGERYLKPFFIEKSKQQKIELSY